MKIISNHILPAAVLLWVCVLASCVKDHSVDTASSGDQATVTFALQMPAGSDSGSRASTRSLSQTDDNTIKEVEVLVFKNGEYKYSAHSTTITGGEENTSRKTFMVKLVKDVNVDLMVLANSRHIVSAAYPSGIPAGTLKTAVTAALLEKSEGKYDVSSASPTYPFLSLWGERNGITITKNDYITNSIPISLVRMITKVDVTVTATNFKLASVHVYNYETRGRLIPDLSAANWDAVNNKPLNPTVPPQSERWGRPATSHLPLVYDEINTVDNSCVGAIYLLESYSSSRTPENRTCMVVGGKFIPDGTADGDIAALPVTYYRVDFASKKTGSWVFHDLKRNYLYGANIKTVSGPGKDTPEDAFEGEVTIDAVITLYDLANQGVIFDGQNTLNLSLPSVRFDKEASTANIDITTDYDGTDGAHPAGIFINTDGKAAWLTVTPAGANGDMSRTVTLSVSNYLSASADRETSFTVIAGNIKYKYKVAQSKDAWLTYTVGRYYMDGSLNSLDVSSNYKWTAQIKAGTNAAGAMSALLTTDGGNKSNQQVYFSAFNNFATVRIITSVKEEVTLTFKDPNGIFSNKDVIVTLYNEFYPPMHKGWAGCNIYYDAVAGHLTFDDVGDKTNATVQGVYFKWGGLTGISPVGNYNTSVVLYPPAGGTSSGLAWRDIPRVDDGIITSNPPFIASPSNFPTASSVRDRAYLYEITDSATGNGDICKYLTEKGWAPEGKWRMPVSSEFETLSHYILNGTYSEVTSSDAAGKQVFNSYTTKTDDVGTPMLPASGFRFNDSYGNPAQVGKTGYYWTGSPFTSSLNGYSMRFSSSLVEPNISNNRPHGMTIRCVRE